MSGRNLFRRASSSFGNGDDDAPGSSRSLSSDDRRNNNSNGRNRRRASRNKELDALITVEDTKKKEEKSKKSSIKSKKGPKKNRAKNNIMTPSENKKDDDDNDSLDTPIPRVRSRELLDAFLDQIEKDLEVSSIGSSALKQLHEIKAQLAADEEDDEAAFLREEQATVESTTTSTDEQKAAGLDRKNSSSGGSGDTAKASNKNLAGGTQRRPSVRSRAATGVTVPSTVEASSEEHNPHDDSLEFCSEDTNSIDSDLTGLTGVFPSTRTAGSEKGGRRRRNPDSNKDAPSPKDDKRKPRRQTLDSSDAILEEPPDRAVRLDSAAKSSRSPSTDKKERTVSFDSVFVRQYERILENNPSCSSGPSIGIGWKYEMEQEFFVDDFERLRLQERKGDLVLTRDEREDLLLDLGYTEKQLAQAVRSMIKEKNKRRQTVQNLGASGVEEMAETARRRMRKLLSMKKKKGG